MSTQPLGPPSEPASETDLLLTLAEEVAAGRTRLRVTTGDDVGNIELRIPALSLAALAALRTVRTPDTENAILASLSPRERTVLRLVADGLTNRQIAAELHLAEKTVRNRLSMVFAKLGIERRSQAAAFAVRNGLADPDS